MMQVKILEFSVIKISICHKVIVLRLLNLHIAQSYRYKLSKS